MNLNVSVWLRVLVVHDLKEAYRLLVRVQKQQAQQLAMDAAGSAGDGRQEVQVTAMVPMQLPVLGNLACRLFVKVLVWVAWAKQLSVPVPVPRSSARAVVPEAEVEREILSPIADVAR